MNTTIVQTRDATQVHNYMTPISVLTLEIITSTIERPKTLSPNTNFELSEDHL